MKLNTKSPEYWWADGTHTVFNKYYLDKNNHIVNRVTNKHRSYSQNKAGYSICTLRDNQEGKCQILIARMLVSTFVGKPPTLEHTIDHINRIRNDDRIENLCWATKSVQRMNQFRLDTRNSAFIIIRDGLEKTAKEWVEHLKNEKNHLKRTYTNATIKHYAQRKQYGFSYKDYPDLSGEIWLEINGSRNSRGHWEISNMNRIKWITEHAGHVLSGESIGLNKGYPYITLGHCHTLAFKTFFPDEYQHKRPSEIILHKNDNKLDFRPQNLRLGTFSQNSTDAHDNGCYDDTKSQRQKCASYINGAHEKNHESQSDAVRYLRSSGWEKADSKQIRRVFDKEGRFAYGRTWKLIV